MMKLRRILLHTAVICAGVFATLVLPFLTTDYFSRLVSGTDAITSATVVLDQPSGNYVVLVNRALHTDEDNLRDWITFFEGGEITYIFEDISCSVGEGDAAGLAMAQSFQSRLPENQMTIQRENAAMLASRVDYGRYDIVIMSAEFAESYQIPWSDNETAAVRENMEIIELKGGEES